MSTKRIRILSGVVLTSALLTASMALQANNAPVQRPARSTTVQFGDLNLDSAGGVAALYRRLSLAAARVCGSRAFTGIYYTLAEYRSCVADATQSAVTSINRPALTEFYRQQLTQSPTIRVAEK